MTIKWVRTYVRTYALLQVRKLLLFVAADVMVSVFCCLCCATLEKAAERRNLFSESSQSVVPLLLKTVTCSYGKGVFREVFKSNCKVCRPCFRCLDWMTKLDQELQEKQVELSQHVKRLGDRVLGTEFVRAKNA